MENFTFYNPTKLHFGRNVVGDLGKEITTFGKNILLLYGGGSVKKNGSYDDVMNQIKSVNARAFEYKGIKSNPIHTDIDNAAELGRMNNVDLIMAVGGGSVIDSAKAIAVTIPVNHSCWDFYEGKKTPEKAVPLIDILTLAATGTETNMFSVIQNDDKKFKTAIATPLIYPKHAYLDPQYTVSVPANYTAYGIVDLIAHCLELYFGKGDSTLSDKFIFSIIREAMEFGPALMNDLSDYDLRAKILLASTMALNGITFIGKESGDWGVHSIGHNLSVMYDIAHGASLSIVYPAWLKFHEVRLKDRIENLGRNLFQVNSAHATIDKLESFFTELTSPVRLSEYGTAPVNRDEVIDLLITNKAAGNYYSFNNEDYQQLVDLFF